MATVSELLEKKISKKLLLTNLSKGKNPEQVKILEYFLKDEGCFNPNMSDDEYSLLVAKKRDSLNLRQIAVDKSGLDEDELNEIPPICLEGYVFKNAYSKKRANGNWVSTSYQVTWLFFSASQVFVYNCTFSMYEDKKKESTDEFFYKDITSFSTSYETEKTEVPTSSVVETQEVETNKFTITVPGEKIYFSMLGSAEIDEKLRAVKNKLREKK